MTVLLDNKGQGKVGDTLAEGIQTNASLSILSNCFSIYGYYALKKQLARTGDLRLLIPSNDFSAVSGGLKAFRVAGLTPFMCKTLNVFDFIKYTIQQSVLFDLRYSDIPYSLIFASSKRAFRFLHRLRGHS